MKECVVILGMHRSGTSVISGLVSTQGYYIGVSEMPTREDNPKGFFENHAIYRFNQRILEDHRVSWDSHSFEFLDIDVDALRKYRAEAKAIIKKEFGLAINIFIKDPRMCLLFPLWEAVLKELKFKIKIILVLRSPMEVALSLRSRNKFVLEKSLLLWSHYNLQAEKSSRTYKDRLVVHYADDFSDFDFFWSNLSKFLGVEPTEEMYSSAKALYSPKLTHHKIGFENITDEIPDYLRASISVFKAGQISRFKKLDKIYDEFYLSQDLYLYDDFRLRRQLEILENEKQEAIFQLGKVRLELDGSKQQSELTHSKFNLEIVKLKEELKKSNVSVRKAVEKKNKQIDDLKRNNKVEKALLKTEFDSLLEEAQQTIESSSLSKAKLNRELEKARELSDKVKLMYAKKQKLLEGKLSDSYKSLAIGNQLFFCIQTDKKWQRKFSRLLKTSRYFKLKRFLLSFSKKESKQFLDDKIDIISSGLFSPFYYLSRYPKAWERQVDPLNFFNKHGWKAGQNPGPDFDTRYYLEKNEDVARSGENPLLHYIRIGKVEGRLSKPSSNMTTVNTFTGRAWDSCGVSQKNLAAEALKFKYLGATKGEIIMIKDGFIFGWLATKKRISEPVVKINGFPTKIIDKDLVVSSAPDNIKHDVGFKAKYHSSVSGEAKVELLLLTEEGVTSVSSKCLKGCNVVIDKYADLKKAHRISKLDNAVAITVWEGAHNPIGRAKVLYDIVASERPVVIFAYIFGDFGSHLWEPLRSSDLNIVLIPYAERHAYKSYIHTQNIKFDTIWICKHRLHSFELASYIAKPNAACILDMDDNEDVFVSSKASTLKPYGIFSKNKANYYLNRIETRSVASISIQHEYGGAIVRHARKSYDSDYVLDVGSKTKTAIFIGTIRPHKNVGDLVSAISRFNKAADEKIILAIGGDFNPPSMREELNTEDTIILDKISSENLFDTLASYDIVITGYPDKNNENQEINKLQITSKIGDGLSVGLPVLTPMSPSVEDLLDVPGLFVFSKNNFDQQLKAAMSFSNAVELPDEFTIEYSYGVFKSLEAVAKESSQAKDIFELESMYNDEEVSSLEQKNIVLVWKQHDSGVYGRRIDHVARYYKQLHPENNVTVIEAISESKLNEMKKTKASFDNLSIILNDVLSRKVYCYSQDGVEYRLITYKENIGWNSLGDSFDDFLTSESIYPHNSVIILFPLLDVFNELISVIKDYKVIVDLVDNQVKWMKTAKARLNGLKQYYDLISLADEVVANSPENIQFFKNLNFFEDKRAKKISNWYTLPSNFTFERRVNSQEINLIYSGNLNDRVDWALFKEICEAIEPYNGFLHIMGTAVRSADEMQNLLKQSNCVYHGVVNEKQLLRLLQHMNFAVVPHVEDHISKFMDPIKLKMYKKLGIASLCSQLPDLPMNDPMLVVAGSRLEFIEKLNLMLKEIPDKRESFSKVSLKDDIGDEYMVLINNLLNCG